VVSESISPILYFSYLTEQSTFVPISIVPSTFELTDQPISLLNGSLSLSTKTIRSTVNNMSPFSCLPRWVSKTIEAVSLDVDDIYLG